MDEQSAEVKEEVGFGLVSKITEVFKVSKKHRGLQVGFTAKKNRGGEGRLAPALQTGSSRR